MNNAIATAADFDRADAIAELNIAKFTARFGRARTDAGKLAAAKAVVGELDALGEHRSLRATMWAVAVASYDHHAHVRCSDD